jgi:hypothetical protein
MSFHHPFTALFLVQSFCEDDKNLKKNSIKKIVKFQNFWNLFPPQLDSDFSLVAFIS